MPGNNSPEKQRASNQSGSVLGPPGLNWATPPFSSEAPKDVLETGTVDHSDPDMSQQGPFEDRRSVFNTPPAGSSQLPRTEAMRDFSRLPGSTDLAFDVPSAFDPVDPNSGGRQPLLTSTTSQRTPTRADRTELDQRATKLLASQGINDPTQLERFNAVQQLQDKKPYSQEKFDHIPGMPARQERINPRGTSTVKSKPYSWGAIAAIVGVFLASIAIVYAPALTQWASVLDAGPSAVKTIASLFGTSLSAITSTTIIDSIAYTMFLTNMVMLFFPVSGLILLQMFGIVPPELPKQEGEQGLLMNFFAFVALAMVAWAALGWGGFNIKTQLLNEQFLLAGVTFGAATINSIAFNKDSFPKFAKFIGYILGSIVSSAIENIPGLSRVSTFVNDVASAVANFVKPIASAVANFVSSIPSYLLATRPVNAVRNLLSPLTSGLAHLKNWSASKFNKEQLLYGNKLFWFGVVVAASLILTIGLTQVIHHAATEFFITNPSAGVNLLFGNYASSLSAASWAWAPLVVTIFAASSNFIINMVKMFQLIFKTKGEASAPKPFSAVNFLANASKTQLLIAALGLIGSVVGGGFALYLTAHSMLVGLGYSEMAIRAVAATSTIAFGALFAEIIPIMLQVLNINLSGLYSQHRDFVNGSRTDQPNWSEIIKEPNAAPQLPPLGEGQRLGPNPESIGDAVPLVDHAARSGSKIPAAEPDAGLAI